MENGCNNISLDQTRSKYVTDYSIAIGTFSGYLKHTLWGTYALDKEGLVSTENGTSYKGDIIKNKLEGNGQYRWKNGETYTGEVKYGLRHGYGKLEDSTGDKVYNGRWVKGRREGFGNLYFLSCNAYYKGNWKGDMKHGKGTMKFSGGEVYEGEWKYDKPFGYGVMHWPLKNLVYKGEWQDGLPHGYGMQMWETDSNTCFSKVSGRELNNCYKGYFKEGKRHGNGSFQYSDGSSYVGPWHENMKHGQGVFKFCDGSNFIGKFENNKISTPDLQRFFLEFSKSKNSRFYPDKLGRLLKHIVTPEDSITRNVVLSRIHQTLSNNSTYIKQVVKKYIYEETKELQLNLQNIWEICFDLKLISPHFTLARVNRIISKIIFGKQLKQEGNKITDSTHPLIVSKKKTPGLDLLKEYIDIHQWTMEIPTYYLDQILLRLANIELKDISCENLLDDFLKILNQLQESQVKHRFKTQLDIPPNTLTLLDDSFKQYGNKEIYKTIEGFSKELKDFTISTQDAYYIFESIGLLSESAYTTPLSTPAVLDTPKSDAGTAYKPIHGESRIIDEFPKGNLNTEGPISTHSIGVEEFKNLLTEIYPISDKVLARTKSSEWHMKKAPASVSLNSKNVLSLSDSPVIETMFLGEENAPKIFSKPDQNKIEKMPSPTPKSSPRIKTFLNIKGHDGDFDNMSEGFMDPYKKSIDNKSPKLDNHTPENIQKDLHLTEGQVKKDLNNFLKSVSNNENTSNKNSSLQDINESFAVESHSSLSIIESQSSFRSFDVNELTYFEFLRLYFRIMEINITRIRESFGEKDNLEEGYTKVVHDRLESFVLS